MEGRIIMKEFYMSVSEQVTIAAEAYIVCLKTTSRFDAYAVYLRIPGIDGLKVLWPQNGEKLILSDHVRSKCDDLPAYYFRISDVGMSRAAKLANTLRSANANLKIFRLDGGIPSAC